MKGWQLIEIRREIEGRFYRFTCPAGVPVPEMIEVMKDWQSELEQVKTESSDEKNKELHGPAEDEPTEESQEASSEGSSEAKA